MNASELVDIIRVQQGQQPIIAQEVIINEIIGVLLRNKNMSVNYAKDILINTIKAIENMPFNKEQSATNFSVENECYYLKSIADSLNKISEKGIDVFNSSFSTKY